MLSLCQCTVDFADSYYYIDMNIVCTALIVLLLNPKHDNEHHNSNKLLVWYKKRSRYPLWTPIDSRLPGLTLQAFQTWSSDIQYGLVQRSIPLHVAPHSAMRRAAGDTFSGCFSFLIRDSGK